jgi:dATP pyrophosphohydrolase
MTSTRVAFVDVYPVRVSAAPDRAGALEVLALRRSPRVRCGGAWEVVHGHIEPGESPVEAALRELREETGLVPDAFYNLSRVEAFYLHGSGEIALIPVFAAVVAPGAPVVLSAEHDDLRWLDLEAAGSTLAWPRERRSIADIGVLLPGGEAGPLEDVLRIDLSTRSPG